MGIINPQKLILEKIQIPMSYYRAKIIINGEEKIGHLTVPNKEYNKYAKYNKNHCKKHLFTTRLM